MKLGLAALTGATGFLGQHLVAALSEAGWTVRILARRDPVSPLWAGVEPEVVAGDLADAASLNRLCAGADLVIHAAGLIGGSMQRLRAVNVEGARSLALAARRAAPSARVTLISSLAAREPQLSAYAATKHSGEAAAREVIGESLSIVRPPAIYGPGDRETLMIFRAAARSPVLPLLDPRARVALIHVEDAARQIVALASGGLAVNAALSDARFEGYHWREIMQAAAVALERQPQLFRIPKAMLFAIASLSGIGDGWRHGKVTFTLGKVRELTHLDWGIQPDERARGAPAPVYDLLSGFKHTVSWYRKHGWL